MRPPAEAPFILDRPVLGPLRWIPLPTATSMPTVVVSATAMPKHFQFPTLGWVIAGSRRHWAWVWREGAFSDIADVPIVVPSGAAALSRRLRLNLSREEPLPSEICVELPESAFFEVGPALAREVEPGAVVYVPRSQLGARASDKPRFDRRLLVFSGVCAPVEVRPHDSDRLRIRCSHAVRMLIGVRPEQVVQLVTLPDHGIATGLASLKGGTTRSRRRQRWLAHSRVRPRRALRLLDRASEKALELVLRAPRLILRTTHAPVGDDGEKIVRLHPKLFASLGITPGAQVVVSWFGLTTAAVALEDYEPAKTEALEAVRATQAVERTPTTADDLPAHLIVRVTMDVRRELGIPAHTVVELKRRLRPLVATQLNQLTIPMAGIFLAGVAVKDLRWWPLLIGLGIVIAFGLAPLRRARPPQGLLD